MEEYIINNPFIEIHDNKEENTKTETENDYIENGIINPCFQGQTGDCWLIAAINALSLSKCGQEIIKNAIKKNNDGSYDVYFKGINKTYSISEETINRLKMSPYYSKGDLKMLLFEIAIGEYRKELYKHNPIENTNIPDYVNYTNKNFFCLNRNNGGFPEQVFYLLSKRESIIARTANEINKCLSLFKRTKEECVMCLYFQDEVKPDTFPIKDINGNEIRIIDYHTYSVKDVHNDNITLVNPHDSSKEITISVYLLLFLEVIITYCYLGK